MKMPPLDANVSSHKLTHITLLTLDGTMQVVALGIATH